MQVVGDLRREYGYSPARIAALGHRDLAHDIAGLSPQSAFASVMGDQRRQLNDPAEAQKLIDRFL